jgi:hypothetical protein
MFDSSYMRTKAGDRGALMLNHRAEVLFLVLMFVLLALGVFIGEKLSF